METQIEGCSVYSFLDYRSYIRKFYETKKLSNPRYSLQILSRKADLGSRTYLNMILSGTRNLSYDRAVRLADAMGLSGNPKTYFLHLVEWNQSKEPTEKEQKWRALVRIIPQTEVAALKNAQFEVLNHWYVLPLLEAVYLKDFRMDSNWLGKRFRGQVPGRELLKALERLIEMGFLKKNDDGTLTRTDQILFADSPAPSELILRYHLKAAQQAMNALLRVPAKKREYTAITLAVREEDIPQLKSEAQKFSQFILQLGEKARDADHVYHMNLQLFPLTQGDSHENS